MAQRLYDRVIEADVQISFPLPFIDYICVCVCVCFSICLNTRTVIKGDSRRQAGVGRRVCLGPRGQTPGGAILG